MGRTNATYRDALRAIEERWAEFRRALRRRDQPRFDRMFEHAREHADASGLLTANDLAEQITATESDCPTT